LRDAGWLGVESLRLLLLVRQLGGTGLVGSAHFLGLLDQAVGVLFGAA
jgi:hypothetical protein